MLRVNKTGAFIYSTSMKIKNIYKFYNKMKSYMQKLSITINILSSILYNREQIVRCTVNKFLSL